MSTIHKNDTYISTNISEKEYMSIVEKDGCALSSIDVRTPEICMAAIKNAGLSIFNIKDPTPELCMAAVKQNGMALRMISPKYHTLEISIVAVKQNRDAIRYVHPRFVKDCFISC